MRRGPRSGQTGHTEAYRARRVIIPEEERKGQALQYPGWEVDSTRAKNTHSADDCDYEVFQENKKRM